MRMIKVSFSEDEMKLLLRSLDCFSSKLRDISIHYVVLDEQEYYNQVLHEKDLVDNLFVRLCSSKYDHLDDKDL